MILHLTKNIETRIINYGSTIYEIIHLNITDFKNEQIIFTQILNNEHIEQQTLVLLFYSSKYP